LPTSLKSAFPASEIVKIPGIPVNLSAPNLAITCNATLVKHYPAIGPIWRRAWEYVVPFFGFAPSIRKMIYTTNCVEALNRSLRKIIKTPRELSQ